MIKRSLVTPLLIVAFGLTIFTATFALRQEPAGTIPVAALMGNDGRSAQEKINEELGYGTWEEYSAWGKELFETGRVNNPPTGPAPSPLISHYDDYTCSRCHNAAREDPVLTEQDPEARFAYVEEQQLDDVAMVQGTTFWGIVNRNSYYNGIYEVYHNLCVPAAESYPLGPDFECEQTSPCGGNCRVMDATDLANATQVCSNYCSVGRYLEDWELASMETYFWDIEVTMADLDLSDLSAEDVDSMLQVLQDPEAYSSDEVEAKRDLLGKHYLQASGETRRDSADGVEHQPALIHHARRSQGQPRFEQTVSSQGILAPAEGNQEEEPVSEPASEKLKRGQRLYELSCRHCHGLNPGATADDPGEYNRVYGSDFLIGGRGGRYLAGSQYIFHEVIKNGAFPANYAYMPEFVLERLSPKQAADILAYLRSLPPTNVP